MRKAISPGVRLAVTLRYLGTGNSFTDLMFMFRVADCTIHKIVMDTCDALYTALQDFMKVPSTTEEWEQIAEEFKHRWNFPNCIGAMDGKHVEIKSPGGSDYFNYLKYHSIILLALVDARYRFLFVDVGRNGRAGDAGVFRASSLKSAIEENSLNIPAPKPLPGREKDVPYFIVGDDAFPLYLMKPYPFRTVSDLHSESAEDERRKQRIYDYRLSIARRISENAFGILAARFGVFRTCIHLPPEKATRVTLAALALHNFLMTVNDQNFNTPNLADRENPVTREVVLGDWRRNRQQLDNIQGHSANRTGEDAREVRAEIKEYVNNEGQVSWQERLVFGRFAGM